jgi:hypothetical protein
MRRVTTRKWVGVALVAFAGCLLVAATFLPWIKADRMDVEPFGVRDALTVRVYSGWDLRTDCGNGGGALACGIGDVGAAATGAWTLMGGLALLVIAGLFAVAAVVSRVAVKRTIAIVGVVVVVAVAASIAYVWASTSPHADTHSNNFRTPTMRFGSVRYGVALAIVGAAVAVVGTILYLWRSTVHSPTTET